MNNYKEPPPKGRLKAKLTDAKTHSEVKNGEVIVYANRGGYRNKNDWKGYDSLPADKLSVNNPNRMYEEYIYQIPNSRVSPYGITPDLRLPPLIVTGFRGPLSDPNDPYELLKPSWYDVMNNLRRKGRL